MARGIAAALVLAYAGEHDSVHPMGTGKHADFTGAGQQQDIGAEALGQIRGERSGQDQIPAEVAEALGVVAIERNARAAGRLALVLCG